VEESIASEEKYQQSLKTLLDLADTEEEKLVTFSFFFFLFPSILRLFFVFTEFLFLRIQQANLKIL
jgi:hypothetical protein